MPNLTSHYGYPDRIRDRLWRAITKHLSVDTEIPASKTDIGEASVSGNMPWIDFCAAYADGKIDSSMFRRYRAVRNIVETVCPTEARHYIKLIQQWDGDWLENSRFIAVDGWGNPIRCPRLLLGTSRPYSPTSLRYLATALWLKRHGKITPGEKIVEIGVGFGGLAAMNEIISATPTVLVDLPQVERAAARMLSDTGLNTSAETSLNCDLPTIPLVISNYAFTELSSSLQDQFLEKYLIKSKHGLIVSNAAVFSSRIGGRSDDQLVNWLRDAGVPATSEDTDELLTPIDKMCGVRLIQW